MPSARRKTDKIQDELQTLGNSRRCRREIYRLRCRSAVGCHRQPFAVVRTGLLPDVRGHARCQPRLARLRRPDVGARRACVPRRTGCRVPRRLRLRACGQRHRRPATPCGALPCAIQGYGRRHHRFERQDRHQGVDRRRTARGDEILPLAEKLQFAAGRAPLGADARRRRGAGGLRGGHFEARRDGAAGAHHPSRRGCFYLDRRRASGEFPQSRAEVQRENGAGPQCLENHLPQLLRAAGGHGRGAFRRPQAPRCRVVPRGAGVGHRQRRIAPQCPDRRGVLRRDALSCAVVRLGAHGAHASRGEGGHQRFDPDQRRL